MKKLKYLLMLLVLMFAVPSNVLAVVSKLTGTAYSDNRHIFSIEEFDISNSQITVSGYSFISHMDNFGIISESLGGNLETYIVVYIGAWSDDYMDPDKCEIDENCYIKKANITARDMFYSRCTDNGCFLFDEIRSNRNIALNNGVYNASGATFRNNNSCNDNVVDLDGDGEIDDWDDDNECIYFNVGFETTIDIHNAVNSFTNGNFNIIYGDNNSDTESDNIKFKVLSINRDIEKAVATGFNIHSSVCTINGNPCGGTTVTANSYQFKFTPFATTVTYDATHSIPFDLSMNRVDGYRFQENEKYNILEYRGVSKIDKTYNGSYAGSYYDALILLDTIETDECYRDNGSCTARDRLMPDPNEAVDTIENYYGRVGHVSFDGEFEIKEFRRLAEPLTCDDIYDWKTSDASEKNISCGETANYHECMVSGNTGKSVNATFYLLEDDDNVECSYQYFIVDPNSAVEGDEKYYLPITISTDVLINQTGSFIFTPFSPSSVKAGKGFNIENHLDGISYTNTVSFIVAGKHNNPADTLYYNTPFMSYSGTRLKEIGGVCREDKDFNAEEEVRKYYSEYYKDSSGVDRSMSTISKIYYKDSDGVMHQLNSLNAAIRAVSDKFFEEYAPNYDSNSGNDSSASNIFKFKSCDSNSSSASCVIDDNGVPGVWDESYTFVKWLRLNSDNQFATDGSGYRGFGFEYRGVYNYNLPYAYVALSDMIYDGKSYKYADVVYASTPIAHSMTLNLRPVGNKYFVGFKYAYDNSSGYDFPFDLQRGNVSLVEEMTWMLSGTCGVDVEDGYYTCDDPGGCDDSGDKTRIRYKYRSINVKDPFPKFTDSSYANAAVNWKDWYWNSDITTRVNNRSRLNKSYDDASLDYSVTFLKYHDDTKLDIGDIVNCSSNGGCSNGYGSMANFGVTGSPQTSKFVNGVFSKKPSPSENKYCGLGLFSPSCDGYTVGVQGGFVPVIPNTGGSSNPIQGGSSSPIISTPITGGVSTNSSDEEVVDS